MLETQKPVIVAAHIDRPASNDVVYHHGFSVLGWFFDTAMNAAVESVEARIDGQRVGSTRMLYDRADVRGAHPGAGSRNGFELLCTVPEAHRAEKLANLLLFANYVDGTENLIGAVAVRFSKIDYRHHGHGYMLSDKFARVLRREDVYGSGPPSPVADASCVNLVLRYIDHARPVLDIGCGIGAYGKELLARAVSWHGVEVIPEFCARMTAEGLPNSLVSPGTLPFADGSFESGISIEVLEHVDDYDAFLAEIARVVRGTVCFSVPNAEGITLMSYMHALPWHMLESDHKNFFSRGSLRALLNRYFSAVEIFTYGNLPNIRSYEGLEIPNHLFAVVRSGLI